MATRPEELQNWTLWDFDENPVFKFQTGNPTYGYGGGTIFSQQMEQNDQTAAITLTEDGQLNFFNDDTITCLLYTSPSPRDISGSRMPSSA